MYENIWIIGWGKVFGDVLKLLYNNFVYLFVLVNFIFIMKIFVFLFIKMKLIWDDKFIVFKICKGYM